MHYKEYIYVGIFIICCFILYEYIREFIKCNKKGEKKKYLIRTNFGDFINFIIINIPSFIYSMFESLIVIVGLPFSLLIIFAEKVNFRTLKFIYIPKITKIFLECITKIKDIVKKIFESSKDRLKAKQFLQDQLNIYYECISTYIQDDNLKLQSGFNGYFIGIAIFLLQFGISFATTLAGANLIFGSVSVYAPFIFTLVVQGLIVFLSNKGFEKNKRSRNMKSGLWVAVIISVFFSYTGIVIGQDSPISRYRNSYEVYETIFKNVKNELKSLFGEEGLTNQLTGLITNLDLYKQSIEAVRGNYQNTLDTGKVPTNFMVPTWNPVTQKMENRFDENLYKQAQAIAADRATLQNNISVLNSYMTEFNKLDTDVDVKSFIIKSRNDYQKEDENKKETDQQNDGQQDNQQNDEQQNTQNNTINISSLKNLVEYSIEFKNTYEIDSLPALDKDSINNISNDIKSGVEIEKIEITPSSDIFKNQSTEDKDDSKKGVLNFITNLWSLGIDQEMSGLASSRTLMRDNASNSFKKISIYKDKITDQEKFEELESRKNDVLSQLNLFSYAIDTFAQDANDKKDLMIMLFIAVVIDFGSAFLGYIKQKKSDSFIYVKTSKDYYDEYDDIFEIIFMSLMRNFEVEVKDGKFISINAEDFKNNCMKQIAQTSEYIKEFLDLFEISVATYTIGFNLKCKVDNEKLSKYKVLISILLKTNLMKIVTSKQYNILREKSFMGGTNCDNECKDTEYYYLLRNKGENYLRENIPFQFLLENNDWEENDNG